MDFSDQLRDLVEKFEKIKPNIATEEATKHALVLPFLQILGFNIFDPTEITPEFTADIGIKKGEKVDYAININSEPVVLIEVKTCGTDLNIHTSQLIRYFNATPAQFAILTDGIKYLFFSDIEEKNKMDTTPFLEVSLTPDIRDTEISQLKKFHKTSFDPSKVANSAKSLKYLTEIKAYIKRQLADPDEEFCKFILKKVYTGILTQKALSTLSPLVNKAISQYLTELVSDKFKHALKEAKEEEIETSEATIQPDDGIITTDEELESFYVIKSILRKYTDASKIEYKDTKSYFGILYEGNTWKWICRLRLSPNSKSITFHCPEGQETYHISCVDDIYKFEEQLKQSLDYIVNKTTNK